MRVAQRVAAQASAPVRYAVYLAGVVSIVVVLVQLGGAPSSTPIVTALTPTPAAVPAAAVLSSPASPPADTVARGECETLEEYITLFRDQEDRFFGFSKPRMGAFFDAALARGINNGFLWADWADAEATREVLDFSRIDGMLDIVCRRGMRTWLILSLYHQPSWVLETWPDAAEIDAGGRKYGSFAWSSPAFNAGLTFLYAATRHAVNKYGACIIGINPNLNNEVEVKWTQEWDAFRDYSVHTRRAYGTWLSSRNPDPAYWAARWGDSSVVSLDLPTPIPVGDFTATTEDIRPAYWDWVEFREMLAADVHQRMCQAVLLAAPWLATFLHVPTFLSSIDAIYSVPFPALADSPWVHHMSLDSNLVDYTHSKPLDALHIKLLATLARPYQSPRRGPGPHGSSPTVAGLRTHYELAVERLERKCIAPMTDSVAWALGAGVGSIGYTNVQPDDVEWLVDCAQRAFEPGYKPGVAPIEVAAVSRRERAMNVTSAACIPPTMLVVGVLDALASRSDFRSRIVDVVVDVGRPELQPQNLAKYDIRLYLRPAVVTRRVARLVKAMLATAHFEVVDLPGYPRSTPAPDVDALRCGPHYLDRAAPATLADLLHPPRWAPFTEDA